MKRQIKFRPAFDKRDPDPKKNYGIHGMEMQFQLIDEEKHQGITYTIFTNWHLPHVQKETDAKNALNNDNLRYMFHKPMSAGVDAHMPKPHYKDQSPISGCEITGGDCYCDGTGLTEDFFNCLVSEGEEALWKMLEDRYNLWTQPEEPK